MFDRTDVLWREEPTPAPTDKAARGNDQVRQVNDQPDAPGQRPTDAADDRHTYGPPREPPDEHGTARQYRDDPARAELATERHDRERERLDRITQAREDGRTWTEGHAWTDQDRAGIQRCTKDTAAPREETDDQRVIREYDERHAAREESNRRIDLAAYQRTPYTYTREPRPTPAPQLRTDGHRREYNAREAQPRDRRTRATRDRDAIADVGMYRAVSYTDISEQHYDNHPYVTRRAVNRMVRDGLLEEHEATGPQGNTFTVLTATARGRDAAHRAALDAGHVPEQQTWTGLVKPAELSHDTAVYRAALDERARIEADGGRVVRVRLDAELKSLVATATETARARGWRPRRRDSQSRSRPGARAPHARRPCDVPRRPARHRGQSRHGRAGERGDRLRPLPRGGDCGESRRGFFDARQQPIRQPEYRPRARARRCA